ncbi:MAG: MFS transporter [Actinomycetota bacterium]
MTCIDTSRDVPGTDLAPRTSALALVVICTGHFLVILDAMVVNVALPSIGHDLHGGVTGLQWDVDAYTLSFAGLLLTAGTMAERLGARPVFLGGVAAFTLASAACGLAPSLGVLVAARAVQGIGAAALVPSSLVLLRPPTRPGPGGHAPWGSGARSAASARRPGRSSAACSSAPGAGAGCSSSTSPSRSPR